MGTDKKIKITIPEVKVSVDTNVLTTAALKQAAAKAISDGVKKEAGTVKAGGKLYAKYDAFFGATDTAGYDAARRALAAHMKETKNDFKYVVTVPAAQHAAEMTAMNTKLSGNSFSEANLKSAIGAAFTAAGNLGNATVTFAKPANMAAQDATPAATSTTSGAAAATGLVAMVFTG